MEKIIETKICKCGNEIIITDKDRSLLDKISPTFSGVKYMIPNPTLCPACREKRRLSFRNERNLYRSVSNSTGKNILSIYSPDKPFKILEKSEWLSDIWDAFDYGREFDFSRGFFEQFQELYDEVPKMSLTQENSQNSDYTNRTWNVKDCYLSFITGESVNSHYLYWSMYTNDSMDSGYIQNSDICYECMDIEKCYNLQFSQNCKGCRDSKFLFDCESCSDCFLCVGLRNKNYHFLNKELSKEDYKNEMSKIKLTTKLIREYRLKLKEIGKDIPVKFYVGTGNENVSGNYINNSKNSEHCFDVGGEIGMEDCKYCTDGGFGMANCMDSTHGAINYSYAYECLGSMDGTSTMANIDCWGGTNFSYYCTNSFGINNCFGCTGIRNSEYSILNKKYTKAEYEILVPKIIEHMKKTGEWGEFFPSIISPFGYNETVAMEYYPMTQKDVETFGQNVSTSGKTSYKWSTYENPIPKVDKTIPASKLPEDISQIPDDILNWAIECEVTNRPFRIIKQELDFYRKHGVPVPTRHPDQRHLDRISLRNPRVLYSRKCDKCGIDIRTTYSPDRPEKVYCENCYNKEF